MDEIYSPREGEVLDAHTLEYDHHDPFNTAEFHLIGSTETSHRSFFRLSEEERNIINPISPDVAYLSTHSAGIQLLFKTDSRVVKIRVRNTEAFGMKNMSFMGCSGFDSYYSEDGKQFLYHTSANATFIDANTWVDYPVYFRDKKVRYLILDFPLYNGVFDLDIMLEKGSFAEPFEYENKKKILCYGTSIMQGCACPRPGLNTTNYLSRELRQEVYNYGFSGAANLEKEIAEILVKRDYELMTIDCEANAGCSTFLAERFEDFLDVIFKAKPDIPVIVFNRVRQAYDDYFVDMPRKKAFCDRVMKENVEEFARKGHHIYFVDNFHLIDGSMTIEGLHPTADGMMAINKNYLKAIRKVKEELQRRKPYSFRLMSAPATIFIPRSSL